MSYDSLRQFVDLLDQRGQIKRIAAPVEVELEIAEIADRCVKSGGPALLFERPTAPDGAPFDLPVLINAYGSDERVRMALGVESLEGVAEEVADLL
ncbi:MAG: UbiD family decarboxylase, partial [Nitrospinota bacterium]|nr:UbiD family decarboxylase [Nitrospinota bacterium]